jgi:DNA polymerase III epsilon subunit-like protein
MPPSSSQARTTIWPGWRRQLGELPYVAIDIETTGLDPSADRVIEFAACDQGGIEFATLVDPRDEVEAAGPHGLTLADLEGAPAFESIAWRIRKVLASRVVVAHNASFDLAFLRAEFQRIGRRLAPVPSICTMELPAVLGFDHESRSLWFACHRHGIPLPAPHTAEGDALAAAQLFATYSVHADRLGLDLEALSGLAGTAAGAKTWGCPALPPPMPGEFAPSLAARRRS